MFQIALRWRSKNATGHLETTHAVCNKAIVKRKYLVLVFFSHLDGYNRTLLLGGV